MANQENNKIISPLMEDGQGHLFHVAGANFKVTGSHINTVTETNDLFNTLVTANNLFTLNESGISLYYDFNSKKAISKIEEGSLENFDKLLVLNEKLTFLNESAKELRLSGDKTGALKIANQEIKATTNELNETKRSSIAFQLSYIKESNKFFIGNIEMVLGSNKLSEDLFAGAYIKYEDKALIEIFETAAKNFDTYTVLDFVTENKKDQITVVSMKAENNAFVYKVNEDTKISKFSKSRFRYMYASEDEQAAAVETFQSEIKAR